MIETDQLYFSLFGEERVKEKYKYDPHHFSNDIRVGGKQYCTKCGTIALNNPFSQWSVRMGCLSELHPEYKKMRKKTRV